MIGIRICRTLTPQNQKTVLRPTEMNVGLVRNNNENKWILNTNENKHNEQDNKNKKQKGTLLEIADFVVSKKVKNSTILFAFANDIKAEGKKDLANFVLFRSGKSLGELLENARLMENAQNQLQRSDLPFGSFEIGSWKGLCFKIRWSAVAVCWRDAVKQLELYHFFSREQPRIFQLMLVIKIAVWW